MNCEKPNAAETGSQLFSPNSYNSPFTMQRSELLLPVNFAEHDIERPDNGHDIGH
jgi:hypothetical protein